MVKTTIIIRTFPNILKKIRSNFSMILSTSKPAPRHLSHVKPANSKILAYLQLGVFWDEHVVAVVKVNVLK